MNAIITNDENQVIEAIKYRPAVSIILPFDSEISLKSEMDHKLKIALEKVKRQLLSVYPDEKAYVVINKLQKLIAGLQYDMSKKSMAIFVSPLTEKVIYLDIEVKEKLIIDESFEIRDLVYNQKEILKYILLILSAETSKMFRVTGTEFIHIKSTVPENIHAYENDISERVSNFSDPDNRKEDILNKYVQHIDHGLTDALKEFHLPVFIAGAERTLGHFKKITKNEKNIVHFIHGNFIDSTEPEILELMKPYTANWGSIMERNVLRELEKAMDQKKLAAGMKEVWQAAAHKNNRLLVVEKDFMYPAHLGLSADSIYQEDISLNRPFYIKDAVDEVIEKVLESGGEVEFVDNGSLNNYEHIALVEYYSN
ncbi:hypothetical protein [Mucilaginibacter sp.]|uniref:baeRF3 domain-containing protein n=1 Tax=Mucilaginibacter sp. TaxID=1882438 RepID=UPI00283FAF46|nr:hypothetical protein [Mucilaginibacter sp.]MDR3693643.1 hypothetical protein [Mucilaginibacter sp.]